MLRQTDALAGLGGAIATVPLLALGLTILQGRIRSAFATGADMMVAAVLAAGVVAAARGGAAPWKSFEAIEAVANGVLALACLCALLPPRSRLGSSGGARVLAAVAGAAIILRGGLVLAVHTGLAVRDEPARISGVALGIALVCLATALVVVALRAQGATTRLRARPWLLAGCGVLAISTAVALACAQSFLFPIQLRAPAGSTFVSEGSAAETLLQGLTGIAHAVPRAQVVTIAVALVVAALLAALATHRIERSAGPREPT